MEFVGVSGLRVDGRRPGEVRRVGCELGVVSNGCAGSACIQQGCTHVLATVHGPREVAMRMQALHDRALVRVEVSYAPFSTTERKRRRPGDRRNQALASKLRETFSASIHASLFKSSEIDIVVHVLQADGGLLSACVNAVSLALVDAGVPMVDYAVSCSVGYLDSTALLDLNHSEESCGGPQLIATLLPKSGKLLSVEMASKVPVSVLQELVDLACVGCHQLSRVFESHTRDVLASKTRKRE